MSVNFLLRVYRANDGWLRNSMLTEPLRAQGRALSGLGGAPSLYRAHSLSACFRTGSFGASRAFAPERTARVEPALVWRLSADPAAGRRSGTEPNANTKPLAGEARSSQWSSQEGR